MNVIDWHSGDFRASTDVTYMFVRLDKFSDMFVFYLQTINQLGLTRLDQHPEIPMASPIMH